MALTEVTRELNEYTNIAFNILQSDTNYIRGKRMISEIFEINRENRFETIFFRLKIIDSYYSTQMNRRFFGLDDLAKKLSEISPDDKTLQSLCNEFILDTSINNGIGNLLSNNYGIRKTGHEAGQAVSLISKYLYFLTSYKFPIYDNLVKISYSLIEKKYPELAINELNNKFDNSYFDNLRQLNCVTTINDFNKLDNLLWLIGKLTEGSLSLILNKQCYLKLMGKIKIKKGIKSKLVDTEIRKYIIDNIDNLNDLFTENEIKFLKYTHKLNS